MTRPLKGEPPIKFLYTSDIHASPSHLPSMLSRAEKEEVDGVIIGGDIVPHEMTGSRVEEPIRAQALYLRERFLPAMRDFWSKRDIPVYLDFGNDDFAANRFILEQETHGLIRLLHESKHELMAGVDIIGYMIVPPTPFQRKDWEKPDTTDNPYADGQKVSKEGYVTKSAFLKPMRLNLTSADTIEKDLGRLSRRIRNPFIFVSHAPPYDTAMDVIYNGCHVGSIAIRRFLEEWSKKGLLVASFHGHIHESPDRTGSIYSKIGDSFSFNPGQGNGRGSTFRYMVFELSGAGQHVDVSVLYPTGIESVRLTPK